jgi:protein TonB
MRRPTEYLIMAYAPEPTLSPRRLTAITLVVLLHVGIILALKEGLAQRAVQFISGPIDVKLIEEATPEEKQPPPPPVKIDTPPPQVPPPEVNIEIPTEAPPTAITAVAMVKQPPPPPRPIVRSTPHQGNVPLSKPDYPPNERRLSHEGSVVLQLYVLENGRVGDAKVQASSGYPSLDEAALEHAKRVWRFVPAKEDGKPVAMWYPFKVTFKLTDAE